MKKLLMVPLIALLALAGVGFASSLDTNGSSAIEAGVADVSCADNATLSGWNYEGADGSVSGVDVTLTNDDGSSHTCAGLELFLHIDGNGSAIGSINSLSADATQAVTISPPVLASSLENIRIGIS